MRKICKIVLIVSAMFFLYSCSDAQIIGTDTIKSEIPEKQQVFYDSLKFRAGHKGLKRIIYDFLISPPRPYVDQRALSLNYYSTMEGKVISKIDIIYCTCAGFIIFWS